jgi:hypothetical protein
MLGAQNVNGRSQNETDGFRAELYHPSAVQSGPRARRFPLVLHLKKYLARKKFDNDDEVQQEVMTWFKGQAADFYDSGLQKLVPRLYKCLDNAVTMLKK